MVEVQDTGAEIYDRSLKDGFCVGYHGFHLPILVPNFDPTACLFRDHRFAAVIYTSTPFMFCTLVMPCIVVCPHVRKDWTPGQPGDSIKGARARSTYWRCLISSCHRVIGILRFQLINDSLGPCIIAGKPPGAGVFLVDVGFYFAKIICSSIF